MNSRISLPRGGDWVDVCYLPEGAFSADESVRTNTFMHEMEVYMLLTEIGGMIGTPSVDIDMLRCKSKYQGNCNKFYQGQEELRRIMSSKL